MMCWPSVPLNREGFAVLRDEQCGVGESAIREALTGIFGESSETIPIASGWTDQPLVVVYPETMEQAAETVRLAEKEGVAVLPIGGATGLHVGYPPSPDRPYVAVSSARMARVVDYQPDDMTVTVEPGVTMNTLQEMLAGQSQFLPLDPPLPNRATLGGVVSRNAAGFYRAAYGAPRDLLIGVRAVMSGGVAVHGGGRVVKNVAGYDLCKLFVGAWGTLGFLTELTFKIRPMPEKEAILTWSAPDIGTAAAAGLALHHARIALAFVLATTENDGGPQLLVGLHGTPEQIAWQTAECSRLAAAQGLAGPSHETDASSLATLRDLQAQNAPEIRLAGRIASTLTNTPAIAQALAAIESLDMTVQCAVGTVAFVCSAPVSDTLMRVLAAVPADAHCVLTRLDAELAESTDVERWGTGRAEQRLHRALKEALDPLQTFSPGRFIGRL